MAIARMEEVYLSLGYLGREGVDRGVEVLRECEDEVAAGLGKVPQLAEAAIEMHLVGLGDPDDREWEFIGRNFSCVDEYLCIKTLAYFTADLYKL